LMVRCLVCTGPAAAAAAAAVAAAAGLQVNKVANDGSTPLSKAAMNGKGDIVRALCEAGADPNIQAGKKNWGAIHYAARRSQLEAMEIMLEFGADPTLQGGQGETAYKIVKGRYDEVNAEFNRLKPVMALLSELEDDGEGGDDDDGREGGKEKKKTKKGKDDL
jgi:ankyrin repeat protein